jgi:hypothetical protein
LLAIPSGRIPSDAFGRLSPLIMALTTAFRVPSPPPATIAKASDGTIRYRQMSVADYAAIRQGVQADVAQLV